MGGSASGGYVSTSMSPAEWSPRTRRLLAVAAIVGMPLFVALALAFGPDPVQREASQPLIHRGDGYVGKNRCEECHPEQHATWQATFHRTMTQRPGEATVRGRFDGTWVRLFGGQARPFRDGERFLMDVPTNTGERRVAEIALAIGSRRYQQYFERESDLGGVRFRRLPLLWHIEAGRWMHLNGVFLEPDDDDWTRHASVWNENCIFCHNTGPRPGKLVQPPVGIPDPKIFDSKVAELGIACEACHGPGEAHAARHRNPLTRYAAHVAGGDADDIIDPDALDHERSTALCGQCHGQRLPNPLARIHAWMATGPTFKPGNRLAEHVTNVQRDTPSIDPQNPELFRDRFWGDGTARLTAYELQGTTQSPCYERGKLSCNSCHVMHGGDPRGMIEPSMRGDRACTQCHAEIGADVGRHTGHRADGAGSRCLDCHMPRIVYGILGVHRSHRIEIPDPARDGEAGRPHACTLCHVDKTLAWSAQAMNTIWPRPEPRYRAPASRPDGAALDLPDACASLLAGDPVQRAVYAHALGEGGVTVPARQGAFLRVQLIATLFDAYPSVRWFAARSLATLESEAGGELAAAARAFDHTAERGTRESHGHAMFARFAATAKARFDPAVRGPFVLPDFRPDLEALVALFHLQSQRAISIGE